MFDFENVSDPAADAAADATLATLRRQLHRLLAGDRAVQAAGGPQAVRSLWDALRPLMSAGPSVDPPTDDFSPADPQGATFSAASPAGPAKASGDYFVPTAQRCLRLLRTLSKTRRVF